MICQRGEKSILTQRSKTPKIPPNPNLLVVSIITESKIPLLVRFESQLQVHDEFCTGLLRLLVGNQHTLTSPLFQEAGTWEAVYLAIKSSTFSPALTTGL